MQFRLVLIVASQMLALIGAAAYAQSFSEADAVAAQIRAQGGNAKDQFLLGAMYEHGKGVAQDRALAASWYEKAATQGHARAQIGLGNLYDKGEGVAQSYSEALFWYHKAAGQGDPEAMFFIGSMIFNGEGLTTDFDMAMAWFERAAERGYQPAIEAIATINQQIGNNTVKPVPPANQRAAQADANANVAVAQVSPPSVQQVDAAVAAKSPVNVDGSQTLGDVIPAGQYAVQIGSFKTTAQAQSHWARTQKKLPTGLGKITPRVIRKELPEARIVYRLNAGVFEKRDEARAQCTAIKDARIDCLVVRY